MRDLGKVIDEMIAVIPPTEGEVLISRLKAQKESFLFSAPELVGMRWGVTAECLAEELGNVRQTEGWKKTVQDIWMNRRS
ncbi:MAG: hypothetical protein E6R03_03130 [Hyphomicrobiaceae bacterium]|nr:MAG: hypothetical protein E6R03_03130 [Hyphomicrobiaceae bacterium]